MSAIDYDSAAAYWGESVPGDASAGLAAYAAGTIGVLSAAALGAMFAVEVPRGGPYVFGRLNDFSGGVFFATTIPVIIQLHRRLPATRASRTGLAVVVGASGAAAASGVLLALQVMPFGASTAVSITGIVSQAAWAAASQHSLLHSGRLPAADGRSER